VGITDESNLRVGTRFAIDTATDGANGVHCRRDVRDAETVRASPRSGRPAAIDSCNTLLGGAANRRSRIFRRPALEKSRSSRCIGRYPKERRG